MNKYILLLTVLLVVACKQQGTFEGFYSIKQENWCIQDTALFKVDIPETGRYGIDVCVRHNTNYEFANLWCFVYATDSVKMVLGDTINMKLAEPDGRWCGSGYSLKLVEHPLKQKIVTLEKGAYTFKVGQGMRVRCVKGIADVGIRVVGL